MKRYWLHTDRLLTGRELRAAGISRLRCLDLGKFADAETARTIAAGHALRWRAAAVAARNVRLACDSGRGARWGLSADQIRRLRAGEILHLEDSLGGLSIGYSRTDS